jgi:hypothetical protein
MNKPLARPWPLTRRVLIAALLTAGTSVALPAHADRGVRVHGAPGWGRAYAPPPRMWVGPRYHSGFNGWWIVGAPWVFYPPPYYSPPPVIVEPEPPIVLPDLPPPPQSWYFCDSARAYYPYAQTCPEGWRSVPAAPTGDTQPAPASSQNWYYCESARAYYPYVQRCPEKWRPVAAQPPTPPQGAVPPAPEGAPKP